jgi:phytoene synthase
MCRISDESVDSGTDRGERLKKIKSRLESAYSSQLPGDGPLRAFQEIVLTYKIPKIYFDQLLMGMEMDLSRTRYATFAELYDYCYKAAGVVGLIMLSIFGYEDKQAEPAAVELGVAMQLTNILRDIKEDYEQGRIYLPQDELKHFSVSEEQIKNRERNENFINLMKFNIERAKKYYRRSRGGVKMVGTRRSRLVVCLMSRIYEAILTRIERNGYDVFTGRAHVSRASKIKIALDTLLKGEYR